MQLVYLKLETDDTGYVLDYKRARGFNARVYGAGPTGSNNGWNPMPQGVSVSLRPGRPVGVADSETVQPHRDVAGAAPYLGTIGHPYRDEARGTTGAGATVPAPGWATAASTSPRVCGSSFSRPVSKVGLGAKDAMSAAWNPVSCLCC